MDGDEFRKQKKRAKTLYLDGTPLSRVAELTGIDFEQLRYWTYEGEKSEPSWKSLHDERMRRLWEHNLDYKKRKIAEVYEIGLPTVIASLAWHSKRMEFGSGLPPLSIRETKELTDILTNLDKLVRADAGEQITEGNQPRFAPLTPTELAAILLKDKFLSPLIPLRAGKDYGDVSDDVQSIPSNEAEERGADAQVDAGAARGPLADQGRKDSEDGRDDQGLRKFPTIGLDTGSDDARPAGSENQNAGTPDPLA